MAMNNCEDVTLEPGSAQSTMTSPSDDEKVGASLLGLKTVPQSASPLEDEERPNTGDPSNDDHKKMKRVLANRSSARASYQRRKKMVCELQSTVSDLSRKNNALEAENRELRAEVLSMKVKMRKVLLQPNASSYATSNNQMSLLDSMSSRGLDQRAGPAASSKLLQNLLARGDESSILGPPSATAMSPELQSLLRERQFLAHSLALARNSGL